MKRLINATTILSLSLYIVPPFAAAQEFPRVTVDGTEVICLPDKKTECPEGAFCVVVKVLENCEAKATEMLAAMAAAAAAAEPAVTDAVDEAAAAQAAADAAAAEAAAVDQAAAEQAAAEQAAAEQAAAEQAAADVAAAEQAAADKAARKAAKQAEKDKAAADAAAAEAAAADEAMAALKTVTVGGQDFVCLPDADALCPEGAQCVVAKTVKRCEAKAEAMMAEAAGETEVVTEAPAEDAAAVAAAQAAAEAATAAAAADPNVVVIEAPMPTDEAVETLETALDTPTDTEAATEAPVVEATPVVVDGEAGTLPADLPPAAEATVTTEVVTEDEARASTEEFDVAPTTVAPGKKTGLSDFEKVGLVALGALIVGAMINGNKQVVSNSGDRVVVRQPDGTYQVYKDDNALLREPGSTVRTETFADGSTRTIVQRTDGSQIVTIRDATGRVLQRVAYDKTGRGVVLIDDLQPEQRVDVTKLPRVQPSRNQISLDDEDAALQAQLAAANAMDLGRTFSLRQIRNIQEVRWLAPTVDVNNITFETGSSAIQATEAKKLSRLGKLMVQMIEQNPGEVFLIEGHTDAVGSAASNLALSDRRAESVAKALTEYFGVPPENLVVQGYGEGELKIESQGDERRNRRASVRIISKLLGRSNL